MNKLLATLLIALSVLATPAPHATASSAERPSSWGRTSAPDQTLKHGCDRYAYTYRVTAPTDEWMAEVFLEDRHGHGIAFRSFDSSADAARDTRTWKLCTTSVRSGRYTLRMKVTWADGRDQTAGWVKDSHFTLRHVR